VLRKSLISIILIILLAGSWLQPALAGPVVDATSAVLIDGRTGRVLFAKNPYQKRPIASTTKIMTGLLVIEEADPEEVVTATKGVENTAESEIYLEDKEKMTVHDLLYALLLQSANDAAVALAKHISGSEAKFVKLMNKKARKIGLKNTTFANPHGLKDVNISTAYDMAQLGRIALKNPVFAQIVKTKQVKIKGKKAREVFNRNKLLWRYPYAVGIKTGYTWPAGYCLVSAAEKGQMLLVAATLNSKTHESSFDNAKRLFEYGFSNFKYVPVARAGQVKARAAIPFNFEKLKLVSATDFGVVIEKSAQVNTKIHLRNGIDLPIKKGDTLGHIKVFEGSKLIATKALEAQKNVGEVGLFAKVSFWIRSLFVSK